MNKVQETYLTLPTAKLQSAYLEFLADWQQTNEELVPWVLTRDSSDFPAFLKLFKDDGDLAKLDVGKVPTSTYWYCDDNGTVIGTVNIRHYLNENLEKQGGHIGYGIRPSYRRLGHATKQLQLALIECQKLGIREALVTCDETNNASQQTIIKNGGQRDLDYVPEDGEIVQRYWIKIP